MRGGWGARASVTGRAPGSFKGQRQQGGGAEVETGGNGGASVWGGGRGASLCRGSTPHGARRHRSSSRLRRSGPCPVEGLRTCGPPRRASTPTARCPAVAPVGGRHAPAAAEWQGDKDTERPGRGQKRGGGCPNPDGPRASVAVPTRSTSYFSRSKLVTVGQWACPKCVGAAAVSGS